MKNYSYEGGPFAEFTIEGSPSTCSPVNISGSYVTGNALDSTNYATVIADVTLAGEDKYLLPILLTALHFLRPEHLQIPESKLFI